MHSLQRPLLDFNDFFALDESDRLVLVLETINAEHLLRVLDGPHDAGPHGYAARVLWSALIAGVVYQIPSIAELRRHLRINPYPRYVCGITSATKIPSAAIVTTAKEADTTQLRPLLEQRDARLPDTPLKLCSADPAYDSAPNIRAIIERGSIPLIPFNPGNEKTPPGITTTLGTPLCPDGLPMVYWGRDGHYLKYRCPEKSGRLCCLRQHAATDRCSLSLYGLVVKLDMRDDPRRYVPVPRESKKFARLYKARTAIERVNGRLKDDLILDALRVRGQSKVIVRVGLNLLAMLAVAVAMAERNRLKDCRRLLTCVA